MPATGPHTTRLTPTLHTIPPAPRHARHASEEPEQYMSRTSWVLAMSVQQARACASHALRRGMWAESH